MDLHNATIRQTLRVTTGGQHLRLRVSNAFGLTELHVTSVTIALPKPGPDGRLAGSKGVLIDSLQTLTFGGEQSVDLPNGSMALSDPVTFPVQPQQVITVTMFLRHGQAGGSITSHPGSRTQSWFCHGDFAAAEELGGGSLKSVFHWYFISGVDAWQQRHGRAMVILGDSITDGRESTDNGNNRWPDLLFDRMAEDSFAKDVAVLNLAAGGSRMLRDSKGPSLMSRLDRDVFAQVGVRYVMMFYGVNDIGTADADDESQRIVGERLILAYKQIVARAHAFGFPVFASPVSPFGSPDPNWEGYSNPNRERTRQRVNEWIRTSGVFDAVVDFDAVVRDPSTPSRLKSEYNCGDYLHPNVAAFQAMAKSFPLELFEKYADGVSGFE